MAIMLLIVCYLLCMQSANIRNEEIMSEIAQLKSLLIKRLGSDIEILSQKSTPLTKPGDNYGSKILKVEVELVQDGDKKRYEYVAKLCPDNEFIQVYFDIENTFKKEVLFYAKIVPTIVQFEKQYNQSAFQDLVPSCVNARINLNDDYETLDNKSAVILLDNLKISNFQSISRLVGFNVTEAEAIIRTMARFHATFVALKSQNPDMFEAVIESVVENSTYDCQEIDQKLIIDIMENLQMTDNDTFNEHGERIRQALDRSCNHSQIAKNHSMCQYYSVVHTDLWVNNIMIRTTGVNVEVKILDFQLIEFDCVLKDLTFFLLTSIRTNLLKDHFDRLLRLYFDSFVDTLKIFGVPELDQYEFGGFLKEVDECFGVEFYHIVVMLRFVFSSLQGHKELSDLQQDDFARKDLLGPEYFAKLKDIIGFYLDRNWI